MSFPVVTAVSPRSVLFTTCDGRTHTVPNAHPRFAAVAALIRMAGDAHRDGDEAAAVTITGLLPRLAGVAAAPPRPRAQLRGPVRATEDAVCIDDEPIDGPVAERIRWSLGEGHDAGPLMAFLANLLENPAKRPVEDLFDFIDRHGLAITEDGHVIGYERVRADGRDTLARASGPTPGQIVQVRRNRVEEDPARPCAASLRFGPYPHYEVAIGLGEDRILAVKVDPRDVVTVPTLGIDGVRCCRYEVLFDCTPGAPAADRIAGVAPGTATPALEPLALTEAMIAEPAAIARPSAALPAAGLVRAALAAVMARPQPAAAVVTDAIEASMRDQNFVYGDDGARSGHAGKAGMPPSDAGAAAPPDRSDAPAAATGRKRLPWSVSEASPGAIGT